MEKITIDDVRKKIINREYDYIHRKQRPQFTHNLEMLHDEMIKGNMGGISKLIMSDNGNIMTIVWRDGTIETHKHGEKVSNFTAKQNILMDFLSAFYMYDYVSEGIMHDTINNEDIPLTYEDLICSYLDNTSWCFSQNDKDIIDDYKNIYDIGLSLYPNSDYIKARKYKEV